MRFAIFGKPTETVNYVRWITAFGAIPEITGNPEDLAACDALLLPGGGDITPAFFGEQNHGSRNIDTRLDILQFQALDLALERNMPVLGICKGMQVINVGLGGSIIQDLDPYARKRHAYENGDRHHASAIRKDSWLYRLYGCKTIVNSAHHQALGRLGRGLDVVQVCPADGCVEAISHESLPVIGVQWHPERINGEKTGTDGSKILSYFSEFLLSGRRPG